MWTVQKSTKCCATCANWRGIRSEKGSMAVETAGPSDRGKCGAGKPGSALPGPCATEGRSCDKYIKY